VAAMNIEGLPGLLKDVEFSFILPSVGYLMVVLNVKYSRSSRFDTLILRIGLSFCLLLFLCGFISLMIQDRAVLATLWHSSPVLYSLLYTLSCLIIIGAIAYLVSAKLRPSLWTVRNPEANA